MKTRIIEICNNFMNSLNFASFNALMFFKSLKPTKIAKFALLITSLSLLNSFLFFLAIELIPELKDTRHENILTILLRMYIFLAIVSMSTFLFIFTCEAIGHIKTIFKKTNSSNNEDRIERMAQILKDPKMSETIKKIQTEKERNHKDSK